MQQPSANGIAALFRGNPAPLQQRIQQEQQAKPGLPPDLQELIALNLVTNEKDAMARQQAMGQLAQMQGPQGTPPTVMQTVQEQARQKMQAQQVQARQQQQAMQAMAQQAGPGPVPEGTQFAQAQPQGIDDLPVEFEMAGGGIVAFSGGGQSLNARAARQMEEKGSIYDPFFGLPEEERDRLRQESELKKAQDRASQGRAVTESNAQALVLSAQAKIDELESNRDALVGQYGARQYEQALTRAKQQVGAAQSRGSELVAQQSQRGLDALEKATPPPRPAAPISRPTSQMTPQQMELAAPKPVAQKPIADIAALADQQRKKVTSPPPAASMTAAPFAAPSAGIAQPDSALAQEAMALDIERMRADPQAGAANKELMYQSRIGAPDTTQRDAMIKQLQEERARQVGPQDGFGQLMEYLGQIAATPRGMSSFEAGAAGARGVRGLEEQRAQKRFDLGSKIIEQEQGKIDASRQYAKEVYGVGEKEYDRIFKEKYDAAKQVGTTEMERKKLAQQETLKMLEMQQEMKRKEMDIEQRKAEEKGRAARDRVPLEQQVFAGYLKAAGGDVAKAYEMMKAIGTSGERNDITAIKAVQSSLLKELSENLRMDAATRARKQAELDKTYADLAGLSGSAGPSSAANPLPANASASNLKVGTVYQTAKGPAKWTGTGFAPI